MISRLSLSHFTAAPAIATDPSSAYTGLAPLPNWYATVVSSPCVDLTGTAPVLYSIKHPVPYVFLTSPTRVQWWPSSAACWSPTQPLMTVPASGPVATRP